MIEMLSATAVLTVLLIVLVQAVGAVSNTWRMGAASVDNVAQARAVLMLIERDVQSMLLRSDLAAFVDQEGKPAFAFYSNVQGGDSERQLSLVGYTAASGAGLDRWDYGMDYETRIPTFGSSTQLTDLASARKERFVEGAVRFECQFVTGTGVLQNTFQFDFKKPDAPTNTRSLVISLLVLDNTATKIADETNCIPMLANEFSGTAIPGATHADTWAQKIPRLPSSLPAPVRSGLRVFERFISIPCP